MNESNTRKYDFNFLFTMIFAQMCILEEIETQDYSKNIQDNNSQNQKKNKKSKNKKKTTRKRFIKIRTAKTQKKNCKKSEFSSGKTRNKYSKKNSE